MTPELLWYLGAIYLLIVMAKAAVEYVQIMH